MVFCNIAIKSQVDPKLNDTKSRLYCSLVEIFLRNSTLIPINQWNYLNQPGGTVILYF